MNKSQKAGTEAPGDIQRWLDAARDAARKAGEALIVQRANWSGIEAQTERDVKLKADREAEKIVLEHLAANSPFPVYSEEAGHVGKKDPSSGDAIWVVDPLDGTFNYSRGQPCCCCSIALMIAGQPALGVVHDFNRDETFAGAAGLGAWLNETPMKTSALRRPGECALMTGFPIRRDFSAEALSRSAAGWGKWRKVRMIGSAALSLAWVASGRADAYHEENVMPWDVAAGLALVKAAGGEISIPAQALDEPGEVWATNGALTSVQMQSTA